MHPILREPERVALYLAAWLAPGALLTFAVAGRDAARWEVAVPLVLPPLLLFSFICLAAWYPCRANPLPATGALRALTVHGVSAVLASGFWWLLAGTWARLLDRLTTSGGYETFFREQQPVLLAAATLLYLLAVGFNYLLLTLEASRRAENRALRLQVLAREAELEAFKTQIDPHFLFNSLNSVSALCGTDPAAARRTAIRLGELLRATLKLSAGETIPLSEELRLATAYLDVERIRFGDRLRFDQQIEPGCEQHPVPALLLQPLLENALKHGIAHLVDGGAVRLEGAPAGDRLRLRLTNPCDPQRPAAGGPGIGLANVRGRLALFYGRRATLTAREQHGLFGVEILLPAPEPRSAPRPPLEVPA